MRRDLLIICIMMSASSLVLSINSMVAELPFAGIAASILFIGLGSLVIGKLVFRNESSLFRIVLGGATLLVVMTLIGASLIIVAQFSEVNSLVALILVGAILSILFVRFTMTRTKTSDQSEATSPRDEVDIKSFLLGWPFLILSVVLLRLLWLSRTGEGGASVWLEIPSLFPIVFLLASISLIVFTLFAHIGVEVKLALITLLSVLMHSIFLLVWYPGRYGDPWSHLGESRYISKTGMPYAYSWILQNSLWVDLLKFKSQYALVVFFERMFNIDIYWIHVLLIPILWSIFTPLIAYKIAEVLRSHGNTTFPLLAAIASGVFPSLVIWGAVSVPNSLGFLFFFFSMLFLIFWMRGGERKFWLLAFLASIASSLAHPQSGIFALSLFFLGTVIQRTSRILFRAICLLLAIVPYPLLLYLHGATFSLAGCLQINNFLSFQSEISSILLILGLFGLIVGIRDGLISAKISLFFFTSYVIILFDYYLTKYGMVGLPYGPSRILVMSDFLLVPFVALGLLALISVPLRAKAKGIKLKVNLHSIGMLMVGVFLALQLTSVLYQAYPLDELVKVQPSVYELEAIRFINTDAQGRYVVLCDPGFASLAAGFLGADYGYLGGGHGLYGYPEWWYPTVRMYLDMTKNPSLGYMREALGFAHANVSYFVVSVRNPDFEEVIATTEKVFDNPYAVFGNEKVYVYKYPLQIREDPGLSVRVEYDDNSSAEVETRFIYMFPSEVNATLTLHGHSSYNITSFPIEWTFLDLYVNDSPDMFNDSSDINSFIYIDGLESIDNVTIKWLYNYDYFDIGWKEDSFKTREWRTHEIYQGTMVPVITQDGNTLTLQYGFTPGSYWYYYYTTPVDVSTNDYPYLVVRWRAESPIAIAAVYFEAGASYEVVPVGSQSTNWVTTVTRLPSNALVEDVMIGLSNARNQQFSGEGKMEVDFILLAAEA